MSEILNKRDIGIISRYLKEYTIMNGEALQYTFEHLEKKLSDSIVDANNQRHKLVLAEARVRELEKENEKLKRNQKEWFDFFDEIQELNPSNYDHDEVCELNAKTWELYSIMESYLTPPKEQP